MLPSLVWSDLPIHEDHGIYAMLQPYLQLDMRMTERNKAVIRHQFNGIHLFCKQLWFQSSTASLSDRR